MNLCNVFLAIWALLLLADLVQSTPLKDTLIDFGLEMFFSKVVVLLGHLFGRSSSKAKVPREYGTLQVGEPCKKLGNAIECAQPYKKDLGITIFCDRRYKECRGERYAPCNENSDCGSPTSCFPLPFTNSLALKACRISVKEGDVGCEKKADCCDSKKPKIACKPNKEGLKSCFIH